MVMQVKIFAGCPSDFIKALVMNLQPAICVASDYVFCEGEDGDTMYFLKRGVVTMKQKSRGTLAAKCCSC